MATMNPEEIEKHDKERAARHEAGHLTVVLASGGSVRAWLTRVEPTPSSWLEGKAWTGTTEGGGVEVASVAVAGAIAEDDGNLEVDEWFELLTSDWKEAGLSPTDAQSIDFANHAQLMQAIEEAISLLDRHRRLFDWAVAQLLAYGMVTNGMAEEAFRAFAPADR